MKVKNFLREIHAFGIFEMCFLFCNYSNKGKKLNWNVEYLWIITGQIEFAPMEKKKKKHFKTFVLGFYFFNSLFKFMLVIRSFLGLREDEIINEQFQALNSLNQLDSVN